MARTRSKSSKASRRSRERRREIRASDHALIAKHGELVIDPAGLGKYPCLQVGDTRMISLNRLVRGPVPIIIGGKNCGLTVKTRADNSVSA